MEKDQFITCVICDHTAKDAVESSCCRSTYCCKCAQNTKDKTCPNCEEKSFTFKESFIARLVIGKMPYECVYCKEKLTLGDADSHSSKCPQTPRKCNVSGCSFEAPTKEFLLHLVSQHKGDVINHFGKNAEGQSQNQVDKAQQLLNPLVKRNNSAGNAAALGTSGKFYCGKALPERCSCCNGYCGPSNGCNCRPCMQLDIEYRNLSSGYWVNSGGWVCRKGQNGNVYCGRKKSGRANDYCGPEEGPPCYSCVILQEQLEGRYKGIN